MRKQFKKVLIIELFLIILALFHFFVLKSSNEIVLIVEFAILTLLLNKFYKITKRNEVEKKNLLLLIIITTIFYYVITYFAGFFIGFIYSSYSRNLLGILRNIVVATMIIYLIESMRETIVKNAKYDKILFVLAISAFTSLEVITKISLGNIHSKANLLQFIMVILIPTFSKNIFLTFSTHYTDKTNSIIYSLIMSLPTYVLPVFPDLGDYINTIILTCLPIVTLIMAMKMFFPNKNKITNSRWLTKYKKLQDIITILLFVILGITIYLVGNFGRYTILAIGSGSMSKTINKGDSVIIDKRKKEYKKNDIIAFQKDGKMVVHRIVKVIKDKKGIHYQTKGDANNDVDAWIVEPTNIFGEEKFRLMFIGWPTVALSETINS